MVDLVVIGGGPAGVTAALRARELGASVTLVERNRMGGTCTNDGCVPTRVLAKAARLVREARHFDLYGLEGPCPQVNFERLLQRAQHIVYEVHEKKQLYSTLLTSGVEVFEGLGSAQFQDPHTVILENGQQIQAEKFIICAGGRSRRLDFPGSELALTHGDIWTLKKLPRSLYIAGAAATGCQVASIMEAFGVEVTLLEVGPRLLGIEDEAVSEAILNAFTERSIRLITGIQSIQQLEQDADQLLLTIQKDGVETILTTEAVMLSTGWIGNLEPLNLANAGVEVNGRYIKVDDTLRTTAPHIYAAGDITGRMMLVQSAGYEALLAAENALLDGDRAEKHTIVPHGGFTDPEYASVGLTETRARQVDDCVTAVVPYTDLDRAVIDGHTVGVCKLIVSRTTHRILGAHVVGEQALEVIHLVAASMVGEIWIEQLAELEIAYPTFTAIVGLAARRIVDELGVRPLAPEWRNLKKPFLAEWERRGES